MRYCHTPMSISNNTGVISKLIEWNPKIHWGLSMMGLLFLGWIKLCIFVGEVKNPNVFLWGVILWNRFSPGNFSGWIQLGYWDRPYIIFFHWISECKLFLSKQPGSPFTIYLNKVQQGTWEQFCLVNLKMFYPYNCKVPPYT